MFAKYASFLLRFNDPACLRVIGDMYGFLDNVIWSTCVVCWRAWFNVSSEFNSQKTVRPGSASHQADVPWFEPASSVTLRGTQRKRVNRLALEFDKDQDVAEREFVRHNFALDVAEKMLSRLVDPGLGRDVCNLAPMRAFATMRFTQSSGGLKAMTKRL